MLIYIYYIYVLKYDIKNSVYSLVSSLVFFCVLSSVCVNDTTICI